MKINSILNISLVFLIFSLFSCEGLDDTYKDYSGDGKIKYLGKCKSFSVTPGWKRFVFNWEKSPDSNIKKIEIRWRCDKNNGIFSIPADQGSFETEAIFENYPYSFECYAVSDDGRKSTPIVQYSRPFTFDHELVLGFPRMVNKYVFLDNGKSTRDLVVFFDSFKKDVKSTTITYYQSGKQNVMEVTKEMFDANYYVIKNIDAGKDILVNRTATVEGCLDPVVFEPFALNPDYISFNLDFDQQIKNRYNIKEITNEFIKQQKTLELDYSLKSLEDILYFSNLETLILGGNRFTVGHDQNTLILSRLDNEARSVFVLKKMNEKFGTKVIIHNNHYKIQDQLSFVEKKGNPILPQLDYHNTADWTVTSSTKEGIGVDKSYPERLLDNDISTLWTPPSVQDRIRTHELTIDMKSEKLITGFKVSQAQSNNSIDQEYYPDIIRILLSDDGYTWRESIIQPQAVLGTNYGESTIIRTPMAESAQYIKVILYDNVPLKGSDLQRNNSGLGDFMVF